MKPACSVGIRQNFNTTKHRLRWIAVALGSWNLCVSAPAADHYSPPGGDASTNATARGGGQPTRHPQVIVTGTPRDESVPEAPLNRVGSRTEFGPEQARETGAPAQFTVTDSANFDSDKVGEALAGWQIAQTGAGSPSWTIEADDSAPTKPHALKQSGVADYPLCIRQGVELKDGFVEVKFKPLYGEKDQAGGLVWRYRDANNYYVGRANALENNVVLYKVESGKRTPLDIVGRVAGYGVNAPVPRGRWSTLRVEFSGTRHRIWLNALPLFEVEDATFTTHGRVGLWTKADSVTRFDDFRAGVSR